jgi:hypothetical protein
MTAKTAFWLSDRDELSSADARGEKIKDGPVGVFV